VSAAAALVAVAVGFGGVMLGALLARGNERRSRSDVLLVEALNDATAAIAEAAVGTEGAQQRWASALARVGLHGPPEVVTAFRAFQDDATTLTEDGRDRLVAALQVARQRLAMERCQSLISECCCSVRAVHLRPSAAMVWRVRPRSESSTRTMGSRGHVRV
jgi:hypothetical protein